ncbi:MAG: HAD-IIA family hydrolase [Caldilineaceae bacterium]|nr:HAD-IIA family hydrolase [Caldilineaceae bacterium]
MHSETNLLERLRRCRAALFDMDGVIYVGNQPLPGVQALFDYLDATGRKWLCITNNASNTSTMFAEKLEKMGIHADPAHILGSAEATASWLAEEAPRGSKVLMLGMDGLRTALLHEGFDLVSDPAEAAYAVVGINFHLQYEQLADVALAIRNGARFIGTNTDPTYPSERGQIPGTGSIIALLVAATGVQPEVVGKPYPGMYQLAMRRLGATPSETLMVGDRHETDIVGAVKLGLTTAGVLTGISSREEFEQGNPRPDFVLPGLPELLERFKEADQLG